MNYIQPSVFLNTPLKACFTYCLPKFDFSGLKHTALSILNT